MAETAGSDVQAEKAGNEEDTDHQDDHQAEDDPLETRPAPTSAWPASPAAITPQIFICARSSTNTMAGH